MAPHGNTRGNQEHSPIPHFFPKSVFLHTNPPIPNRQLDLTLLAYKSYKTSEKLSTFSSTYGYSDNVGVNFAHAAEGKTGQSLLLHKRLPLEQSLKQQKKVNLPLKLYTIKIVMSSCKDFTLRQTLTACGT